MDRKGGLQNLSPRSFWSIPRQLGYYLLGQVLKLQVLRVGPSHSKPPFVASNCMIRVSVPGPHVLLHGDQSVHSQLTEISTSKTWSFA